MAKSIILKLGKGNLSSQGFPHIEAQIIEINNRQRRVSSSTLLKQTGSLPAYGELIENHDSWKSIHDALIKAKSPQKVRKLRGMKKKRTRATNVGDGSLENCSQLEKKLLNNWLSSQSFLPIVNFLYENTKSEEQIQIIIETDDEQTRNLFWHLWDFFEKRPLAQPALGVSQRINYIPESQTPLGEVKILAIFGDTKGINIESDRQILDRLKRYDAKITYLEEPTKEEFTKNLWQEQWDILFFAGHSLTEDSRGFLQFNREEFVSPDELTKSINNAVANGLQLAIINSCDGLGIGQTLDSLSVPTSIVMHEPVHDRIAVEFLKGFLDFFVRGFSLPVAVKKARGQLEGIKNEYPYATWLPVVCQNPNCIPPTWQSLKNHGKFFWKIPLITTTIVSSVVIIIHLLGILQGVELFFYDSMMRSRHLVRPILGKTAYEKVDDRILVVIGDERNQGDIGDREIVEVIEKIDRYKPAVIGVDLQQDTPNPVNNDYYSQLMKQYQNLDRLIGVCSTSNNIPAPEFLRKNNQSKQLATIDIPPQAKDGIIRTIALGYAPTDICQTKDYLGTALAHRYLEDKEGEEIDFSSLEVPLFSGLLGRRENIGFQIILNYRHYNLEKNQQPFQILSIEELVNLNEANLKKLIENKIIIIGKQPKLNNIDVHDTPYETDVLGLYLVAHSASQIVSAVLDERVFIKICKVETQFLLIILSSLIGAIIGWKIRNNIALITITILSSLILYIIVLILLVQGFAIGFTFLSLSFISSIVPLLFIQNKSKLLNKL